MCLKQLLFLILLIAGLPVVCAAQDSSAINRPGTHKLTRAAQQAERARRRAFRDRERARAKILNQQMKMQKNAWRASEQKSPQQDSTCTKSFLLGTNLATLFSPLEFGPSLTLEYRPSLRWAVSGAVKAIVATTRGRGALDPGEHRYQNVGFRVTANAKYFLPIGRDYHWFVGLEGMYKRLDYRVWVPHKVLLDRYYDPENNIVREAYLLQPARNEVHTLNAWGGTPVFGMQKMLNNRWQFEWYVGMGLRYRALNLHGLTATAGEGEDDGPIDFNFPGLRSVNEEDINRSPWTVQLSGELRLSFLLNKPLKKRAQ